MILESSAAHATKRFSESGVTVWRATVRIQHTNHHICSTYCISVDSEDVLVEGRVDTDDVAHLVIDFQLEWTHRRIKVDPVEILKQEDLTVTLATVAWLCALRRLADFDDDDVPGAR